MMRKDLKILRVMLATMILIGTASMDTGHLRFSCHFELFHELAPTLLVAIYTEGPKISGTKKTISR